MKKVINENIWIIETKKDIFKNIKTKEELMEKAYHFLMKGNENFKTIKDNINGKEIQFRRVSGDEYVRGRSNNKLPTSQYKQKLRMAPSIDDLIIYSNSSYHSKLIHENKKFPNGFNNFQGIVQIDSNVFRYIVRIGNTMKNESVFYDLSLEYLETKKRVIPTKSIEY